MKRSLLAILLVIVMIACCGCTSSEDTVVDIGYTPVSDSHEEANVTGNDEGGRQYYLVEEKMYDAHGNNYWTIKHDYDFDEDGRVLFEYLKSEQDASDIKGPYAVRYVKGRTIFEYIWHREDWSGLKDLKLEYEWDISVENKEYVSYISGYDYNGGIVYKCGDPNGSNADHYNRDYYSAHTQMGYADPLQQPLFDLAIEYRYDMEGLMVNKYIYTKEIEDYVHDVMRIEIEHDENGKITKETAYSENMEYYDDGELLWIDIFEYDQHNNISKIINMNPAGEITGYTKYEYKKCKNANCDRML